MNTKNTKHGWILTLNEGPNLLGHVTYHEQNNQNHGTHSKAPKRITFNPSKIFFVFFNFYHSFLSPQLKTLLLSEETENASCFPNNIRLGNSENL